MTLDILAFDGTKSMCHLVSLYKSPANIENHNLSFAVSSVVATTFYR